MIHPTRLRWSVVSPGGWPVASFTADEDGAAARELAEAALEWEQSKANVLAQLLGIGVEDLMGHMAAAEAQAELLTSPVARGGEA